MLDPRDIDAIAEGVARLLRAEERAFPGRGLVEAAEVCRLLRVEREWVYEHKSELGAVRIGNGERGPLRFDAARVVAYVEARRVDRTRERGARRRSGRPPRRAPSDFELLEIPDS